MELLVADQPARTIAHDPDSKFWVWAEKLGVPTSRFRWRPIVRLPIPATRRCA